MGVIEAVLRDETLRQATGAYICGSVAFDTIMTYDGEFSASFLKDHLDDINVSFLVKHGVRRLGGTAANIAYTLGMLGLHPTIIASVGTDFASHQHHLERVGVDCSLLHVDPNAPTAHCYILTDKTDHQLTMFAPGAMATAADVGLPESQSPMHELLVIAPDAPSAMERRIHEAEVYAIPMIFSPAQQLPALADDILKTGITGATVVIGNAYEWHMIEERLGFSLVECARDRWCVMTDGSHGATARKGHDVVVVEVTQANVVDPTGAGDAFLGGVSAGLLLGMDMEGALQIGSGCAAFALEHVGPQTHHFTMETFVRRLEQTYGSLTSGTM